MLQVDKVDDDGDSESDDGSTSASDDEGGGEAAPARGLAASSRAKAAALELLQGLPPPSCQFRLLVSFLYHLQLAMVCHAAWVSMCRAMSENSMLGAHSFASDKIRLF